MMQIMRCWEFCDCPYFFFIGLQACVCQCLTYVNNFLWEEFAFVKVNFDISSPASLQVSLQVLVVDIVGLVWVVSKSFNQTVILNNADPVYPLELFDHFAWNALLAGMIRMGSLLYLGRSKSRQFCLVV